MEHTDTVFNSRFSGNTLDGLDDNLASLCIGVELCLVHDFIDVALGIRLGLVLEGFNETLFGFIGTESGEFFQFLTLLELHLLQFLMLERNHFFLVVDAHLLVVELVFASAQFLLALVE